MVMTRAGTSTMPPDGKDMLAHVVVNVLKQPADSPVVRALAGAGIIEILDLLSLDPRVRNALTYELDDGTVKPLPLGHMNLLRVLKIFADYQDGIGDPVEDWTQITKQHFDDFQRS